MSFILQAPFPNIVTALLLPDPDLGNTEGRDISVEFRQSINGTRSTYVKSSARRRLSFIWNNLGRGKLVEIQEFFKNYVGEHLLLTDFRDALWDVIFAEDPIDTSIDTLSVNAGAARKESGFITLEFLGVQIA